MTASSTDHGEAAEVVVTVAEVGIGQKKVVAARAKSWWDDEIAIAINRRKTDVM